MPWNYRRRAASTIWGTNAMGTGHDPDSPLEKVDPDAPTEVEQGTGFRDIGC